MFVLGELGPHAAVNTEAGAWEIGRWRVGGSGVEGCEHEFGGGHFGEVGVEGGFPWCGGHGEVGCCS